MVARGSLDASSFAGMAKPAGETPAPLKAVPASELTGKRFAGKITSTLTSEPSFCTFVS